MRRFKREDLKVVNEWYEAQGCPPLVKEAIPMFGYIVEGVCAGFLFQTDSKFCMLDGFVANPKARGKARREGLDQMTEALIVAAQERGFKSIMAFTQHPQIRQRCERYGFGQKGEYTLFVRGL